MKNKIFKFIFIMCFMFIIGCKENNSPLMSGISVDSSTVKQSYCLGSFDINDILLTVEYSNNTFEKVPLKEDYLRKSIEEISFNVGVNEVDLVYEEFETKFIVNIIEQDFEIKYSYNGEIIYKETFHNFENVNDLYDYQTNENDTIWYYDREFKYRVDIPFKISSDLTLYTNNVPLEYIDNNIVYREKQDGTYMVYKEDVGFSKILFVKEEVNGKLVTSISNNMNVIDNEHDHPLYEAVFLPKTINSLPGVDDSNLAYFFSSLYFMGDIQEGLEKMDATNYPYTYYFGHNNTLAYKIDYYFIEDDYVYGNINGALCLLKCLFDFKDEIIIPVKIDDDFVYGVVLSGIEGKCNKIVIMNEELDLHRMGIYFITLYEDNVDKVEIEFRRRFSINQFSLLFPYDGYDELFIKYPNDDSKTFENYKEKIRVHFQFNTKSKKVTFKFSDNAQYVFEYDR